MTNTSNRCVPKKVYISKQILYFPKEFIKASISRLDISECIFPFKFELSSKMCFFNKKAIAEITNNIDIKNSSAIKESFLLRYKQIKNKTSDENMMMSLNVIPAETVTCKIC